MAVNRKLIPGGMIIVWWMYCVRMVPAYILYYCTHVYRPFQLSAGFNPLLAAFLSPPSVLVGARSIVPSEAVVF